MTNAFSWGRVIVLMLFATTVAAQEMPKDQPPLWSAKPDVAAFDKMENDRLTAAQRAIDQIVAAKGPKTIENTLVPYDDAIQQLNAAINFSTLMQQVHPDSAYRDQATKMNTKVSGAQTALSLNRDVYQALAALDVSGGDPGTRYYVQRQLLEFRLAGVDKDDATRANLKNLRDQLSDDESRFGRNISDDVKGIEIADASELDGMPQDYIDNHKPGPDGKIHITADEPDFIIMDLAKSDDLRRRFFEARRSRAYPKNRDLLEEMMRIRYKIATLLGYSSWADYSSANRMIGSGSNIEKFVADLDAAARPTAQREFAVLLAEKRKTNPEAVAIATYDSRVFELVRRSQYDFDSSNVRPYMPYKQVKQGIMDTAATLFHVTFRQEMNEPAWDPSVETWDVMDNGKMIGRFYLDMHPRPGKHGHPEMAPVLDGIRGKQLPEAALVCSFPEPTAADPGLMEYEDVVFFFHEFGHLMHHILGGQQPWAGISGISMEPDFAEAPSQMLEEWVHSPQVLASFAHHYQTGEPIPADLVARMNRASAFGRAINVAFQGAMSAASYNVYNGKPEKVDLEAIFPDAFRRYTVIAPVPADAHMYANVIYLGGGSGYYTYMWDLVIAEDFFQQFDQHNLFAGDTPMRYRRLVLEPGGSMSANDLVKNFLGRPQNMTAFQKWMGEEFESAPHSKPASEH
jgi:thimet oligopeptidase